MKNKITIREAVTEQEIGFFWAQLRAYFSRDIFPDPDSGRRPISWTTSTAVIWTPSISGSRTAAITCC